MTLTVPYNAAVNIVITKAGWPRNIFKKDSITKNIGSSIYYFRIRFPNEGKSKTRKYNLIVSKTDTFDHF